MRLETVEKLTHERDLAKRHLALLAEERATLKDSGELSEDEQLRLQELSVRYSDCKMYLAATEPQLKHAVPELARKIRQLENPQFSLLLFERYVLLKPLKEIGEKLHINQTAVYSAHDRARNAYNDFYGIPRYKDKRGRKKLYTDFDD